ncbi:hypothetical protein HMPREF1092_01510 [Clostridium thermobutyricum]|uniref:Flagellin n=1 Tax=Clostridium thermobutyricum TaxID=29372 RepID=N9WHE2_9CLOT|nr:flagellin [Clostridium thermobutyricum]ENZ02275.1 hypothetical protein HMPREF1092_01510 [Clostridium thermobutyricum]
MIINHNMSAMNAHRQMGINNNMQSKAMEKLSSGQRINRAGDDAAGLAISEKMRGQIRGLEGASRNAQDGVSLIQTAEGALNETHNMLQRMRELAVQGANDTNVEQDREAIQAEITELALEITRIGEQTQFNGQALLDGSFTGKLQIGANTDQSLEITIEDMTAATLGVEGLTVDNHDDATAAITTIDDAIKTVSEQRANLGALQNRLEHTIATNDNSAENLQAAESRIRDVDMAKEMLNFSKANILSQASQAMLAQAKQVPQGVLQLLR